MAARALAALALVLALIGAGYWWGHTATDNAWTARQAKADQAARVQLDAETRRADQAAANYLSEHLDQEDRYAALNARYQDLLRRHPLVVYRPVADAAGNDQAGPAQAVPQVGAAPVPVGPGVPVLTLAAVRVAGSIAISKQANQAVTAVTGGALSGFTTQQVQGGVSFVREMAAKGDVRGIYEGAMNAGLTVEQLTAAINLAGYKVSADQVRDWGASAGLPPLTGGASAKPSPSPSAGAGAGNATGGGALSGYTAEQISGGVGYIRDRASAGDIGSIYQGAANTGMTAEQLAAAIAQAGYEVTADQVRDWGAQAGLPPLTETVRKFATGGAFMGGGVVHRPTYFDIGQMGEAGTEGILPLSNINGKLGVSASGMGTGAIVAAIEALQALLATVAANTEAVALHAFKGAKATQEIADRGVGVKPIAGLPLEIAA